MSVVTPVVAAFAIALVLTSLVFGVGIVAIPVAVLALAVGFLLDLRRRHNEARSMRRFREQASENKIDFTARDRETLTTRPPRSSGGG
jgi:uncharacterized membrane protein